MTPCLDPRLPDHTDPLSLLSLHPAVAPSLEERWVGYMIRLERQRRSITQLLLAGELGYGMSSISTLEAGHAYANIKRTHKVFHRLGIEPGLCLEAIKAQRAIHSLLLDQGRREAAGPVWHHHPYFQSDAAYLPVVADTACDRPGRAPGSWDPPLPVRTGRPAGES